MKVIFNICFVSKTTEPQLFAVYKKLNGDSLVKFIDYDLSEREAHKRCYEEGLSMMPMRKANRYHDFVD